MRFASDIYEHPVLSSSEIWEKDDYSRSNTRLRLVAAVSVISVVGTIAGLAVVQATGFKNVLGLMGVNERAALAAIGNSIHDRL
ncbi:hypothetical protein CPB83DRAFT_893289 [Crepidotus variabilis]|uniref:Uncharacterized protein n=1 Tax=Crepidotus variabilis TaxID=179855 RepID=A0A9P6EHK0_9AGAR|nr:hypothetical protein CPB83DRAFT_893289 [Crepidotus variabilis]